MPPLRKTKQHEPRRPDGITTVHSLCASHRFAGAGFSPYEVPKEMGIFHEITRQVDITDRCKQPEPYDMYVKLLHAYH